MVHRKDNSVGRIVPRLATMAFAVCAAASAQQVWVPCIGSPAGSTNCTTGGNVGIGMTAPYEMLDLGSGGFVGTRTVPADDVTQDLAGFAMRSRESGGTLRAWTIYTAPVGGGFGVPINSFSIWDYPGNPSVPYCCNQRFTILPANGTVIPAVMTINGAGNVGIGTASPQHLLHVAGTIGAEEVIVSSTGADYVFEPNYKLQPLSEVAAFIKDNHHLPDIPSAEEMKEKGASVGDMQAKLLAKIEELTLHLIHDEEEIAQLKKSFTKEEAAK